MEKAIIITAPSGAGKTTLVKKLLSTRTDLAFSISACTREKRENEIHARDYYFLHPEVFKRKVEEEKFLEWEEVYEDMLYGTLKSEVERVWNLGQAIIFDIDVKGAVSLKEKLGNKALSIFIKPPSQEALEARLKNRGTETEESFQKRLSKSIEEMAYENKMDVVIVNDDLEQAYEELEDVVQNFLY